MRVGYLAGTDVNTLGAVAQTGVPGSPSATLLRKENREFFETSARAGKLKRFRTEKHFSAPTLFSCNKIELRNDSWNQQGMTPWIRGWVTPEYARS